MTVERLLVEVSSAELTEWIAFARIEADERKCAVESSRAKAAASSAKRFRNRK